MCMLAHIPFALLQPQQVFDYHSWWVFPPTLFAWLLNKLRVCVSWEASLFLFHTQAKSMNSFVSHIYAPQCLVRKRTPDDHEYTHNTFLTHMRPPLHKSKCLIQWQQSEFFFVQAELQDTQEQREYI